MQNYEIHLITNIYTWNIIWMLHNSEEYVKCRKNDFLEGFVLKNIS